MNYTETMKYIKDTAKFGSNYGLSRTEKILELLGNPHKNLKCIHVAGTNGKGSTTAMISKMLLENGYKVGMYTSPFLEEFEERIQVDGQNIPKEDLAQVVTKVSRAVMQVVELGYEQPTEFEIITCAMFLYFYEQEVDFAVVEVGLGGRLDSTNVIIPLVSVIVSISYDHMNILGNSLTEIAGEKAGIIKEKVPVVLYPQEPEVESLIEDICKERNSKLTKVSKLSAEFLGIVEEDKLKQRVNIKTSNDSYKDIKLSLLGKHQLLNCAMALQVIEKVREKGFAISDKKIYEALSKVKWHGRLEILNKSPLVVIDGAHNIDGIKKLKESVETYFNYDKMVLILGILADKQVENMIKTIVPMASKVIAVTPNSERGKLSEELRDIILKYNSECEAFESYEEAYKKASSYCTDKDLLLVSGSLYMIGDMRGIIVKNL